LRVWWYVRRPQTRGAVLALWAGPKLLIVQTSYRRTVSLPGGGLDRGETPVDGVLRELREEVGLTLAPELLRLASEFDQVVEHRRDHVWLFEAEVTAELAVVPDGREILEARWLRPETLAPERVPRFLARYLADRADGSSSSCSRAATSDPVK
jgi:8-oxo-dGTP pyrophosphatase MutT (NUDIX family)